MEIRSGAFTLTVTHTLLAGILAAVALAAPTHPLDPLSKQEILDAVAVVKRQKQFGFASRFMLIQLKEPPKQEVLAYWPGARFARQAFVIVYDYSSNATTEAIVDLREKRTMALLYPWPIRQTYTILIGCPQRDRASSASEYHNRPAGAFRCSATQFIGRTGASALAWTLDLDSCSTW